MAALVAAEERGGEESGRSRRAILRSLLHCRPGKESTNANPLSDPFDYLGGPAIVGRRLSRCFSRTRDSPNTTVAVASAYP